MQERGGQLGESREAAHGSGGDGVVGLAPLAAGDLLGAGVDDGCVGDPGGVDGALDELALATNRLDQIDLGIGQRDGQHQTRKPSSRANISDSLGFCQLRHLEPGEAVLDMHPPGPLGLGDRADRSFLLFQQLEDAVVASTCAALRGLPVGLERLVLFR